MQLITAVARREKTTTTARNGNDNALFISLRTLLLLIFVVVELSSLLSGWQETPRRTLDDARAKWRAYETI
jgi:hypothetical protein